MLEASLVVLTGIIAVIVAVKTTRSPHEEPYDMCFVMFVWMLAYVSLAVLFGASWTLVYVFLAIAGAHFRMWYRAMSAIPVPRRPDDDGFMHAF